MILFTLPDGSTTVIPSVAGLIKIDNSLINIAASPANILLVGESTEGAPVQALNLQGNFYTDFAELKNVQKSGPVVDAARQAFTNQPSVIFSQSINRVYVAKTNQSTSASKLIALPTNYGRIASTRFGESGNLIKSQIVTSQSEVKPSQTLSWLPAPAVSAKLAVNGAHIGTYALDVTSLTASAFPFITTINSNLSGLGSITSGFKDIISGTPTLTVTATDDTVVIVNSATWINQPAVNDTLVIPAGSVIAGAADANVGSYLITASTGVSVSAQKIVSTNAGFTTVVGYIAPVNVAAAAVTGAQTAWATADLICLAPLTLALTVAADAGQGLSFELAGVNDKLGTSLVKPASWSAAISASSAATGSISAAASGSSLTVSLSGISWSTRPAAGAIAIIAKDSPIAGASGANVGAWLVASSGQSSVVLTSVYALTGATVASTALIGDASPVLFQGTQVSNSLVAALQASAFERKVSLVATRVTDGESFPTDAIGGQVGLSVSFYDSAATACTVEITTANKLLITPTASPAIAPISIPLGKYATLRDLALYLNTVSGVSAKVNPAWNAFPPSVLDQVSAIGCLSESVQPSHAGRIKTDHYAWVTFFAQSASIVSFIAGAARKAGLPLAEAASSFLAGGAVGATSNADIQAGLDAGIKTPVRIVIPLFSRDAAKDIEDGLTDPSSTYSIESVHAATVGHVATASTPKAGRRRFANLSFYGSFADSLDAARTLNYERAQISFQLVRALDGEGTVRRFLPWMSAAQIAAGRGQAPIGTSMLRKGFAITEAVHLKDSSIYSDTTVLDFDTEDQGQLSEAISAGLLVFGNVPGQGLRLISPDLSTLSLVNSGQSWARERINVQYALDQYYDTVKSVLENYIGERTSDVSPAVIQTSIDNVAAAFVQQGILLSFKPSKVTSIGNGYNALTLVIPAEAVEFIGVTVEATRSV